jgi:hypothetical protein
LLAIQVHVLLFLLSTASQGKQLDRRRRRRAGGGWLFGPAAIHVLYYSITWQQRRLRAWRQQIQKHAAGKLLTLAGEQRERGAEQVQRLWPSATAVA